MVKGLAKEHMAGGKGRGCQAGWRRAKCGEDGDIVIVPTIKIRLKKNKMLMLKKKKDW